MPSIVVRRHLFPLLTFYRYKPYKIRQTGMRLVPDLMISLITHILNRVSNRAARAGLLGRSLPYKISYADPVFRPYRSWLSLVREPGVTGRWIADPARKRSEDDLVMLYVHGGGFTVDTSGPAQKPFPLLINELKKRYGHRLSVFQLDYELAPEYVWPSQIIETLAAYSYLVHRLGINPSRICMAGDSAAGPILHSTLLHLARPSPDISLPASFRISELPKPGGVLFISPFVRLVTSSPTVAAYDEVDAINSSAIQSATLDYLGGTPWSFRKPRFSLFDLFRRPPNTFELFDPPKPLGKGEMLSMADERIRRKVNDPYVSPAKVDDPTWWREALPGDGRTAMVWGGKEVLAGDIEDITRRMEEAGVTVTKIYKPHAIHDWILYEHTVPLMCQTLTPGPQYRKSWGIEQAAAFLEKVITAAES